MNKLTLVIPAKNEAESLPLVLKELEKFDCKIMVVLQSEDLETINSPVCRRRTICSSRGNRAVKTHSKLTKYRYITR